MTPDAPSFDEAFLSQVRLGILSVLLVRKDATFSDLKTLVGATQGNLGMHLRRLEEAGYVAVEKAFVDRKPRTTCRLTRAGRDAFARHVRTLEGLATPPDPGARAGADPDGAGAADGHDRRTRGRGS